MWNYRDRAEKLGFVAGDKPKPFAIKEYRFRVDHPTSRKETIWSPKSVSTNNQIVFFIQKMNLLRLGSGYPVADFWHLRGSRFLDDKLEFPSKCSCNVLTLIEHSA